MNDFSRLGHKFLRYSLIIPCILSLMLGMFDAGAVKFAEQQKAEKSLIVKFVNMPLRELSEFKI